MPTLAVERNFAPFDDTRKALSFALNQHLVSPPPAMMNQMMAAVKVKAKKRKRKPKPEELLWLGEKTAEQLLEEEEHRRSTRRSDLQRHPGPMLAKSDEPHLAGYILYHFGRLDAAHQEVLAGLLTTPAQACSCGQPCCSGWRPVPRWVAAVRSTCETLMLRADAIHGRKGLSTERTLRQLLVELYYLREGPTLTDIARRAGVTLVTAARHKEWIHGYLQRTETAAWEECAIIFDQAGITGAAE
jgi:hypothetical protein